MRSRSFHILIAMLFGCDTGSIADTAELTSDVPSTEIILSESTITESVTISGHATTVDGVSLSGVWIAIADNETQQVIAETSSNASGTFNLKFIDGAAGDYDLLAFYLNDDVTLIGQQEFSLSDEMQSYQVDLSLTEPLAVDENMEDGAAPPPYGSGCYQVYTRNYMCSGHVWYVATYWTGPWYCYALNGGINWVGVGSC